MSEESLLAHDELLSIFDRLRKVGSPEVVELANAAQVAFEEYCDEEDSDFLELATGLDRSKLIPPRHG